METKQQHGGQRANSGRKPLPETLKKKTSVIRIDAELLPLVEKLKQGLTVTNNQDWQQTSALSEDDIKEQANYIERLTTDKAHLSAQVQQFEKQLHKIKIDSDSKQTEIDKLNAMADNCFVCANWTGEKCELGLTLTGFCCADFEHLRAANVDSLNRIEELKADVARLTKENLQLLESRLDHGKPEHQGETSEPLNLTPDKLFEYDFYGSRRLVAWLNDDSRVFVKDDGKRWEQLSFCDKSNFTEKEGRFYFGNTEIYPVENFKGKLPKTLVMR